MNKFLLTLGAICTLITGGVLLCAGGGSYTYTDPFPIDNTRTATVGYVKDSVVTIHVVMTYVPDTGTPFQRQWLGSGIILDKAGQVLTNWHVADDQQEPAAREYKIALFNGDELQAAFVRSDMAVDLGLLQILDPPQTLVPAVLADYDPIMGQDVLVFGSPRGLHGSVSHGIVSALAREVTVNLYRGGPPVSSVTFRNLIQLDAPINPGNSGGPATDIYGRVIGLVNCGGSSDGIGFAVSIEEIRKFLNRG